MSRAWWQTDEPDASDIDPGPVPTTSTPIGNGWGDPAALAEFNRTEAPL